MKNVMKAMTVLGMILFLLGAMASCKEKNEEEEIEKLVERLGDAKSEEEVAQLADKIDKLEQRAKADAKEVMVRLGQPFIFWQPVSFGAVDTTQFSMTFEDVAVTDDDVLGMKEKNKKCVMILAKVLNLGPRKAWRPPDPREIQVRTDRGYLYRTSVYPCDFFSSRPPFPLVWKTFDSWTSPLGGLSTVDRSVKSIEPEETGWNVYKTWIPENNRPVEIIGQFPNEPTRYGGGKRTNFRLKLTQETRPTGPSGEISKESIVGKYIVERFDPGENELFKEPGLTIFKEDGTIMRHLIGRWVEGGYCGIKLYEGNKEIEIEAISNDAIKCFGRSFIKQQEATVIKVLGIGFTSSSEMVPRVQWAQTDGSFSPSDAIQTVLVKVTIWSDYVASDNVSTLRFKKDGTFLLIESSGARWKAKGKSVQIFVKGVGKTFEAKVEGNTITSKTDGGAEIRYIKQDDKYTITDSTSQPPSSATPSLEEKEKLGQQINTKLEAYSNKDSFPLPPISLALRTTAPDLVEKVETIYFTALDYQFFSLRSLRFAKDFLNEGEVAKSKKYIEKADRYYKLATSLQRDSFSVLDSTYSAAQWMVVYKASRTALGFTATGLGIGASTLFDIGTLYTDYSLDKSTMPLEEAKKNLIAKAISNVLLRFTGASDLVGDAVKQGWGSSRAFPVLQKIVGSSEFKDAVLKEFMRLGGDVGDYAAKKTIEETLERVLRGVNVEKANSTI